MPQLSRTGVSLDEDLLKEFDRLITSVVIKTVRRRSAILFARHF